MALFGLMADSIVVAIIVMTMVYSPAKGQTTEQFSSELILNTDNSSVTNITSPTPTPTMLTTNSFICENCESCAGYDNCTQCSDGYNRQEENCQTPCDGEEGGCKCVVGKCIKEKEIWLIPVIAGIAATVLLVVVVVVICCCCCRRKGPPKPVKRDFNVSGINMEPTTDDIYGNVDNRGNMMRFNMPNETENNVPQPFETRPSLPEPTEGNDFGEDYENTVIGQAVPVRSPPEIPSSSSSQARLRDEENDFEGLYTNEISRSCIPIPLRINNNPASSKIQAPSIPKRPVAQLPAYKPQQLKIPGLPERPSQLPIMQHDNFAYENQDDDTSDMPSNSPPSLPTPRMPLVGIHHNHSMRDMKMPPPSSTNKFNSLQLHPNEKGLSHVSDQDDVSDLPSARPPPRPITSSKPSKLLPGMALKPNLTSPPKTKNKQKSSKGKVVRHIDDDVKGEVQMGVKLAPCTPDYGDTYEVVEYVDQAQGGTPDYGESYETVGITEKEDYGQNYEVVEKLRKPSVDIGQRAPMPVPKNAAPTMHHKAPPQIRKKPRHEFFEAGNGSPAQGMIQPPGHHSDPDQDDPEDYTNVPTPGSGPRRQVQTHHHQPPLPERDFYDDVMTVAEVDTTKYYNNIPTEKSQQKFQGYIHFKGVNR